MLMPPCAYRGVVVMDPDQAPDDFEVMDHERRPSGFIRLLVEFVETGEVIDDLPDDEPSVTPDP
jgi:hypothetical protein